MHVEDQNNEFYFEKKTNRVLIRLKQTFHEQEEVARDTETGQSQNPMRELLAYLLDLKYISSVVFGIGTNSVSGVLN